LHLDIGEGNEKNSISQLFFLQIRSVPKLKRLWQVVQVNGGFLEVAISWAKA
jgi:hypothetical protein